MADPQMPFFSGFSGNGSDVSLYCPRLVPPLFSLLILRIPLNPSNIDLPFRWKVVGTAALSVAVELSRGRESH